MDLSVRKALAYTVLPGLFPRLHDAVTGGFGFVSYSLACLLETCRLLPRGHPYTNPVNLGRFGIRHVMAQGALNLKMSWRNSDQIAIFVLLLAGMALFVLEIGLALISALTHHAHAAALPTTFDGFFTTANPVNDIAFMLLDAIFGIPDMFNSCISLQIPCLNQPVATGAFPEPYHAGLQSLFEIYSIGLLIVASLIMLYLVATFVSDWAQEGVAFGQRFNRAWAPLRLVAALGLLVPMNYNLNGAQWITLYVAKWGSGLGTNGWNFFLEGLGGSLLGGDPNALVSKSQYPPPNELLQFFTIANTCFYSYWYMYDIDVQGYFVRSANNGTDDHRDIGQTFATMQEAQQWFNNGDIVVVFGDYSPNYNEFPGHVRPLCGQVTLPTHHIANPLTPADDLDWHYYSALVQDTWLNPNNGGNANANVAGGADIIDTMGDNIAHRELSIFEDADTYPLPTQADKQAVIDLYDNDVNNEVNTQYNRYLAQLDWVNEAELYGWAGAAIWFNKIAQVNGEWMDAVFNIPIVTKWPTLLEYIQKERAKKNAAVSGDTRFSPDLGVDEQIKFYNERDKEIEKAMNQSYMIWNDFREYTQPPSTGNVAEDTINALFKSSGLWSLRANQSTYPLAAMAAMGKTMILESAVVFGGGSVAGLASFVDNPQMAAFGSVMTKTVSMIALICFTIGILLYYIVPFMPFVYFFFAVVGWMKTIFEALIGTPLWAMSHLRYDGEGFPTQQAMYGYFIMVDVFIRPIIIVFSMVGSIIIFYAMAKTLNEIFDLVTSNLTGFDMENSTTATANQTGNQSFYRAPLDQLMFTIMYSVIVYMIGTGCFKMIDLMPRNVMRWMGASVQAFGDIAHKPGEHGEVFRGRAMAGAQNIQNTLGDSS